eukprot:CAMPEP_0172505884 /NCGR_PEP_ID=MMETSP1066-20121228/189593_1 /TAXON_ID=671091 /ORGANISM="Coscinodiscus wailesii, Strain CCMP2513" /LENGTH=544 /DNA_ID=CAMNT_0013282645 /DNA_START=1 /DNA_END=1635 /DNA_ORIENTATION=+
MKDRGHGREDNDMERQKAAFMPTPSRLQIAPSSPPRTNISDEDIIIATRRVTCAVCAFGGVSQLSSQPSSASSSSIFRQRYRKPSEKQCMEREKYQKMMPTRYYENENHLSWENEDNPPVEEGGVKYEDVMGEEGNDKLIKEDPDAPLSIHPTSPPSADISDKNSSSSPRSMGSKDNDNIKVEAKEVPSSASAAQEGSSNTTGINNSSSPSPGSPRSGTPNNQGSSSTSGTPSNKTKKEYDSSQNSSASVEGTPSQPKMKYRCKLCGLPKQNHVCAYQQSLQRSIGTQIYPAVNAFTADEPGVLAPALSEMNNFVGESAMNDSDRSDTSPQRPPPLQDKGSPANVTPETLRLTGGNNNPPINNPHSPGSSISFSPHGTPYRKTNHATTTSGPLHSSQHSTHTQQTPNKNHHHPYTPTHSSSSRKRKSPPSPTSSLFITPVDLKPEQYRIVTPQQKTCGFTYPSLPLPYAQRKRLSDNLFSLSKEVPQLTDECAVVLREARERDQWDQAVAELMTQVVVVVHCHPEEDGRLMGLRNYLLGIGIAC